MDRQLSDEKLHDLTRIWGQKREEADEAYSKLYAYIELERCKNCPYRKESHE